jgi:hypothetical protein
MIGHIRDVHFSDDTWYGSFEGAPRSQESPLLARILDFISFSEDWNGRVERNPANPPDASEFGRYSDLLTSGLWFTRSPQGDASHIAEAPVFFSGGEVTWRTQALATSRTNGVAVRLRPFGEKRVSLR